MVKNVLHVVSVSFSIPYFIGDQFDYFSERGFRFYVASSPSEHFFKYAHFKNFTPWPINIERKINVLADISAIFKLAKLIKSHKIQIVVGHTPKGGLIAMLAAILCNVPQRIYFRHGLVYETTTGYKRVILKTVERISGFFATKVICVSPSIKDISDSRGLSSPKKNIILGKGTCNGVNTELYTNTRISHFRKRELRNLLGIKEGEIVVGFVGRLVNDKGINELCAAWKNLTLHSTSLRLVLVGPFDDRDSLDDEIKEYIINEPSISYTGFVDQSFEYYSVMDIFILPSYREGFPTVALEASSMELPIITTRSTGCIDSIIEGQTGIFTDINVNEIAYSINFYVKNKGLREQHGKNGRKFVIANFRQETVWKEIENKIL